MTNDDEAELQAFDVLSLVDCGIVEREAPSAVSGHAMWTYRFLEASLSYNRRF